MIHLILIVLAILCFALDEFNVALGSIKWQPLGLAFFAATFVL